MPHALHCWRMAGAALALASLAACSGGAVDTTLPAAAEAPPAAAIESAAPAIRRPPRELAIPTLPSPAPPTPAVALALPSDAPAAAFATMQPIPDPEDLPPAERARIYGVEAAAAPERPPVARPQPARPVIAAAPVTAPIAPPALGAPSSPSPSVASEPVRPPPPVRAAPAKSGLRLDTTRSVNLEAPIRRPRPGGPIWLWLAAIAAALAGLFAWIAARRANQLSINQRRKFRSLADRNRTVTFEVQPPRGRGFV